MADQTVVCDIGTGSVKSALFDGGGALLSTAVGAYESRKASTGEIDPEVWWLAFGESLKSLARERSLQEVTSLILTGQMQNLILLDASGQAAPAILYFDARGSGELENLYSRIPRRRIVEITGNTPDGAGFPGKLLALNKEKPGLLKRSDRLLCGAHDYVAYRLTGRARTDRTTAGTTGLLDLAEGVWSEEILECLPVGESILPELCYAQECDGILEEELAAELGLPPGVKVLHGAGDVGASVLASELSGGRVSCYLGSSGWVLDEAPPKEWGDPEQGVFNLPHPSQNRVIRVAPLLTAAGAVEWYLSLLTDDEGERSRLYEELGGRTADHREPTGVIFLPHLAGERSPFKDPEASGVFLGLRNQDDRAKLFRSVLEGVSCAIRSVLEPLMKGRRETTEILLSGGGAQIAGWPEILADVTGLPVRIAADARFVGGRGMLRLLFGADAPALEERVVEPDPTIHAAYEKQYATFVKVYPHLRELMHELRTNVKGGSP